MSDNIDPMLIEKVLGDFRQRTHIDSANINAGLKRLAREQKELGSSILVLDREVSRLERDGPVDPLYGQGEAETKLRLRRAELKLAELAAEIEELRRMRLRVKQDVAVINAVQQLHSELQQYKMREAGLDG